MSQNPLPQIGVQTPSTFSSGYFSSTNRTVEAAVVGAAVVWVVVCVVVGVAVVGAAVVWVVVCVVTVTVVPLDPT